jgi:hypothetical protein
MHHIILNFPFYIDDIYIVAGFFFNTLYRNNDGTLLLLYNELWNYWRNEIFIFKNIKRNTYWFYFYFLFFQVYQHFPVVVTRIGYPNFHQAMNSVYKKPH